MVEGLEVPVSAELCMPEILDLHHPGEPKVSPVFGAVGWVGLAVVA